MAAPSFTIRVGKWTAASDPRQCDAELMHLCCELAIGGGRCAIELGAAEAPAVGDEVTVSLSAGAGATQVFAGKIDQLRIGSSTLQISAVDSLATLARLHIESAFEETSAGAIVKDVLGRAGLTPGQIDEGPTFPRYLMHRGPRALAHLLRLAELCGTALFADGDAAVHFRAPTEGPADHTFRYREHVLALDLLTPAPAHDGVVVYGEGAASKAGAERAHVLVADLESVRGEAGETGPSALHVNDGAVRTGEAAASLAAARLTIIESRALRGSLTVLPAPEVRLGDRIGIDGLPREHPATSVLSSGTALRARSVRYTLSLRGGMGFTTRIGF